MLDEFPLLARLRSPRVAQEPLFWAFLSGVGATPIVGGTARLIFLWLGPIVQPPTQQHPEWLTVNNLIILIGAAAAGAVLMRAGGVAAVGLYIGYELLRALVALPGRLATCANFPGQLPSFITGCDYLALVTERWVTWSALLLGCVLGLLWLRGRSGDNTLLRAAGAFSITLVVVSSLVGLAFQGRSDTTSQNATLALFAIANLIAGGFAGVLLARRRFAAPLLLALLIVAPGVAVALPLAEQTANTLPFVFRWAGVWVPALAALGLFAARGFVRSGDGGTFF